MSFMNHHMNHPVSQPRNLQLNKLSVEDLKKMSWEELLADKFKDRLD